MNWIFEAYRDVYALPFKPQVKPAQAPRSGKK